MHWNWNKMLALAATSLIALSNLSFADGDTAQMRNLENRVSALEQRKGASGMINPQGRAQVKDGADLFVFADLIYWNAHENGLNVGVTNKGSTVNLANSKVQNVHGKWNWGFRVGAGYNMPHDGWDVRLTWLRYTDTGRKNINAKDGVFIFPSDVAPANQSENFAFACDKMQSKWRLRLNQLDLDFGREFFVSKWLTLRPHGGLRTDWIRQSKATSYKDFESPLALVDQINTNIKDRWWGIGLVGGLDTQWGLGRGWSIFANSSAAIIYGFHKMGDVNKNQPGNTTAVDLDSVYRISHPILDMELGIRWDNMFCNDRFHLGLQIGWEHHIYFSQNQFPVLVSDTSLGSVVSNQGDLALQGWTFSARFDF